MPDHRGADGSQPLGLSPGVTPTPGGPPTGTSDFPVAGSNGHSTVGVTPDVHPIRVHRPVGAHGTCGPTRRLTSAGRGPRRPGRVRRRPTPPRTRDSPVSPSISGAGPHGHGGDTPVLDRWSSADGLQGRGGGGGQRRSLGTSRRRLPSLNTSISVNIFCLQFKFRT